MASVIDKGRTETIQLPGADVRLVRKGKGAPMLLLHGGGGPVAQLPFADKLAERFEIFAPVHPGFDGTKIPEHFDGLPDLIYLYLDLLDALELRNAVVVGMSLGGWLAAELAVISCARFTKLVLVDAVGVKHGGPTDREIADIFGMPAPDATRLLWHDPAKAPDLSKLDDKMAEAVAGNRIALAMYGWEPWMHNPKLKHRIHRVKVPTLVLWGESDRLVTPEYGRKYAALIPGAEFVAIPAAGHAPHIEQPDIFVKHLLEFVG
jgi:pimeloyl-ACP methyl ester carboxylesterase